MKADVKAKWLERLRDPDTKQGIEYLRRLDNSMCCLGVLCELAVEAEVIPPPQRETFGGVYVYGGDEGVPPYDVLVWAGLPTDVRAVVVQGIDSTVVVTLAELNDDGWTFAQIADLIEENF